MASIFALVAASIALKRNASLLGCAPRAVSLALSTPCLPSVASKVRAAVSDLNTPSEIPHLRAELSDTMK